MPDKSSKELNIIAFGFEQIGFTLPKESSIHIKNIGNINFIPLSNKNIENADGVIIPQGIFEKITLDNLGLYATQNVEVYEDHLLEKEKELINLIQKGKWVCFLVQEIIDSISKGRYNSRDISDTDLCKRVLNLFGIWRGIMKGESSIACKNDAFKQYLGKFGIAKTYYSKHSIDNELCHILAVSASDNVVAFEFSNYSFFLPFHTTKKDEKSLKKLLEILCTAIIDYRQKNIIQIPKWLDEFQFNKEAEMKTKINELMKNITSFQKELELWRNYKTILATSGENLRKAVINIFENYFKLIINPIDNNIEDAKILDENDKILSFMEVKGTKKGVKREHINQVDSHRERNGFSDSIPGLLIINNEMSINGIEERFNTKIAEEHIKHAKNLKVLIIRAIDLLYIMKLYEEQADKGQKFLKIILSEPGLLTIEDDTPKIIDS